jgi:diguanylate cyclase (GGDEF)-like protein
MEPVSPSGVRTPYLRSYVAFVMIAGAIAAGCSVLWPVGPALHLDRTVVVLALATLCAEAFPVRVVRRGGSESFDLSSAFVLAAVMTVGPATAVAIQAVSHGCAQLRLRRSGVKAGFNVAQKTFSVAAAGAVAVVVDGGALFGPAGIHWPAAAAFALVAAVFIVANGLLVTVVCALAEGEPIGAFLRREVLRNGRGELLLAMLAPLAVALVRIDPLLIALLALPAWALRRSGQAAAASYYEARHDSLTGLPNRVKLREDLDLRIRSERGFGVLSMDLDRFAEVNHTLGPDGGDLLLVAAARRIGEVSGDGPLLVRLQDDAFGVVVAAAETRAPELARRLVAAFQSPLEVDGLSLEIGLSAGIALHTADIETSDELLRRAHVARYAAKDTGTGIAVYDPGRDRSSRARLALTGELRHAIAANDVQPFFQPQVDLRSGEVVGCEALVRWIRPDGSLVPPLEFIPHVENGGLIKPLTRHVLAAALTARHHWAAAGTPLRISVNLSARSLLDPELVTDVRAALHEADVPAHALELEVTESAIMADADRARDTLRDLHQLGVHLAIDDFGTGYSSLAYLSRLPVHSVKIDRSFVGQLDTDPAAELIVRMTVDLGHNLGLTVIAEGVEDTATRNHLRDLGCDTAQGFLWSPAIPAHAFLATIATFPQVSEQSLVASGT